MRSQRERYQDSYGQRRAAMLSAFLSKFLFLILLFFLTRVLWYRLGFGHPVKQALLESPSHDFMKNHSTTLPIVPLDRLAHRNNFYLDSSWDFHGAPNQRIYHWSISEILGQPGRIMKRMLVVNEQSPGPTIRVNVGDQIIVHVINNLVNETAIHWHGQYQNGTNHFDGTFGVTQCGIPPNGGLMVYNFTAQNAGTFWWHAHYSTQYADGLYGALIVHSPDEASRPNSPYDHEIILMIGDFYNTFSQDILWRYLRYGTGIDGQPGNEPVGDGGIINGVSQAECAYLPSTNSTLPERRRLRRFRDSRALRTRSPPGQLDQPVIPETLFCGNETSPQYASLLMQKAQVYRLRIINVGSFSAIDFSIDGHALSIIEADGVNVEPILVEKLFIGVAQRYSVLLSTNQRPGAYWVRAQIQEEQIAYPSPMLNSTTLAVLRYEEVEQSAYPIYDKPPSVDESASASLDYNMDLVPIDVVDAPDRTRIVPVTVSMQYDTTGEYRSFFNDTSWEPLTRSATLFEMMTESTEYSNPDQLIVRSDDVEVIDLAISSLDDGDHPFHLHGHTFFIMGQGVGRYTGERLNAKNPMRRDTIIIPGYSWAVLRFVTDNPGLWAFHCHITWHMESGLMMQFASLRGLSKLEILSYNSLCLKGEAELP